jgi:hypothetical protein
MTLAEVGMLESTLIVGSKYSFSPHIMSNELSNKRTLNMRTLKTYKNLTSRFFIATRRSAAAISKQLLILTMVTLLAMASGGCLKSKSSHASMQQEPSLYIILIDGSASYKFMEKAKQTVMNFIQGALPSDSKVYVRWITEDSNSDQYSIVSAVLPATTKPVNPFDVKGKKNYQTTLAQDGQIRQQVISTITKASSPQASHTDIYGALYVASERIAANPHMKPVVILLSDMDDNVGRSTAYQIQLNSAVVKVMDYQSNYHDVKQHWQRYLKDHGAGSVSFISVDEPLNIRSTQ